MFGVLVGLLAVLSVSHGAMAQPNCTTIADGLRTAPNAAGLTTLLQQIAQQTAFLDNPDTPAYTLFAPTTAALIEFAQASGASPTTPLTDAQRAALVQVIGVHVLNGSYPAVRLAEMNMRSLPTIVPGVSMMVTVSGNSINVTVGTSTATVVTPDAADGLCNDSVIHEINGVLLPPASNGTANCTGVVTAADCTDEPECTYGRLPSDISLVFPQVAQALNSAETPVTIFLPNDAAAEPLIAAYANNTVTTNDLLGILQIHVVPGVFMSDMLSNGTTLTNQANSTLTIVSDGAGLAVVGPAGDRVPIVVADVQGSDPEDVCGGSVVHVIAGVLEVPGTAPPPPPPASGVAAMGASRVAAFALAVALLCASLL